jgi:hypothetical protein
MSGIEGVECEDYDDGDAGVGALPSQVIGRFVWKVRSSVCRTAKASSLRSTDSRGRLSPH